MSEIEVAEGITPLNLRYNMQSSNPSAYQKRVTSYLYPTQNGTITDKSSRTIRFLVGSNFFLDGRNSYLRLQAKIEGGIGSGVVVNSIDTNPLNPSYTSSITPWNRAIFTSYTETWIKSLTLYTNMGVVIESIRDYNILGAIMKANIEPEYAQSVGYESLNIVDSAPNSLTVEQRQIMASQFKTYIIEMRGSGFLKAFNYLPLKALAGQNSNSFQLEIEFGGLNDMVIAWQSPAGQNPVVPSSYTMSLNGAVLPTANSAIANLGYTLQNIVLVQSLLQDDLMEASLMDTIKSVPLMIHYDTYRHYTNKIGANSGGNNTLSISEYQESVKSLTSINRYTNAIPLQTMDNTAFINPNLQQYQLQIGPIYFPSQPVLVSVGGTGDMPDLGEQYYEYTKENQKAMFYNKGFQPSIVNIKANSGGALFMQSQKDNTQFILTNDLRPFPDYAIGDPQFHEFISGYNTKSSPQPLQLLLQNANQFTTPFPGVNGSDVTVDSFTNYDSYCVIQSNEVYIIS